MKTNLNEILSSVLCDIVLAQHRANLYSQSIADEYQESTGQKIKKIPAVSFSDIELELRYVTDGTEPIIAENEIEVESLKDHPLSSLAVDINADRLASLPSECVQTLKIKISPKLVENRNEQ